MLKTLKFWLWNNWTAQGKLYIYGGLCALIALFLVFGLIFGQIQSCGDSNWKKKTDKINSNIQNGMIQVGIDETIANIQENKVKEGNANVIKSNQDFQNANANLSRIINNDSSLYSGNAEDALCAFCESVSFRDSLCVNRKCKR